MRKWKLESRTEIAAIALQLLALYVFAGYKNILFHFLFSSIAWDEL